jgi:hypothetical protein
MNKTILAMLKGSAAAAAAVILLASCGTFGSSTAAARDEEAVARGTVAWNQKGPAAAEPYWEEIQDQTRLTTYRGYLQSFDAGTEYLAEAGGAAASNEAQALASYQKAREMLAGLPEDLELPVETRARGMAIAEDRMRSLIAANDLTGARELGEAAVGTFGPSQAIAAMNAEIEVVSASRRREAGADEAGTRAREAVEFDDKIARLEAAIGAYAEAGARLGEEADKARVSGSSSVYREASRLRRKRQDLAVEREKLLRQRAYGYRDRIGEEFARVPDKEKVGNMSLEELLEHQESVKAAVEAAYEELTGFADRYPEVADPDFTAEVEEQKKILDEKIAQVNAEIRIAQENARRAREIASRGKVVLPVIIGLFNPEPNDGVEAQRSRPAVFQSSGAQGDEYWWGMAAIPGGTMNDLVITVSDSREVRVFGENTKSGRLIKRQNMKDLVNRSYRIGNSWPVLNAGAQLPTDRYFFEIQKGKTDAYEGEVVVYDSFVVRMR